MNTKATLKKYNSLAKNVKSIQKNLEGLTDEELKELFKQYEKELSKGKYTLDEIKCPIFAIVCETAKRVLNQDPYLVQVIAGLCLNDGNVANMATGEGKTLSATMPAVLNAMTHKGVHIATANEYLANRDKEDMGKIYNFLGLSVGVVYSNQKIYDKQKAYACDITYGTGSEFGFDYLRDNTATNNVNVTNQRLNFAIVDEADSILIDDSNTSLILSKLKQTEKENYVKANEFVLTLDEDDFIYYPKTKEIHLSENGYIKAEKEFGIDFVNSVNYNYIFYINNALKAHYCFKKDVDYKVENDKILIIDPNTGRIMQGREYSKELQQALQAKEHVSIKSPTVASGLISFQNFYNKYNKISGMTGSTQGAEKEFLKNYNMLAYSIPTNKPLAREDEPVALYRTNKEKYLAILSEVKKAQTTGQPLLIGTNTIQQSELLAKYLKDNGFNCEVLNANTQKEADIIAKAGKKGQITISTNIAGRGTDIKLGGDSQKETLEKLTEANIELTAYEITQVFAKDFNSNNEKLQIARNIYLKTKEECELEKEYVNSIGGLRVISTQLAESQRVKTQLIGRSGRQGDNGSSIQIVSLEDELIARFFPGKVKDFQKMASIGMEDDGKIKIKMFYKILSEAEIFAESKNQDQRNYNVKFDNAIDPMRDAIYSDRKKILKATKLDNILFNLIFKNINNLLKEEKNVEYINNSLRNTFKSFAPTITEELLVKKNKNIANLLTKEIIKNMQVYFANASKFDEDYSNKVLRKQKNILISNFDSNWTEFLNDIDAIREDSYLKAYSQQDPVEEFKLTSKDKFKSLILNAQNDSLIEIFKYLEKEKIQYQLNNETKEMN